MLSGSGIDVTTHWSFDADFTATNGTHLNDAVIASSDPAIVSSGGAVGNDGYLALDGNDWLAVAAEHDRAAWGLVNAP